MENLYPCRRPGNVTRHALKTKHNCPTAVDLTDGGFYYGLFRIILLFWLVFIASRSYGQTGIISFTAINNTPSSGNTYAGNGGGIGAQPEYKPASNNTFTYNFGTSSGIPDGLLSVNGYVAGNTSYVVIANIITAVVMRRMNNASASGNRDILFFAGNRNPGVNTSGQTNSSMAVNLNAPYIPDMNTAFFQNNLLIGTDNIFSNQGNGNGNNNNIERVDVMAAGGFKVQNALKSGFPILERGVYGQHDAFKVAVITSLDASGNPASYSNVVSVNAANYNNTNSQNPVADGTYNYFLFRRDAANPLEINQHISNQGIGGVALRFDDFGIANGTIIYGYSILPNDFSSTSGADVVDYTNSTYFPTTTSETIGGLDVLAVIGIGFEADLLPVEMLSFDATDRNGKSELKWTTATEINNKGFSIERSADGVDWKEIGFVSSMNSKGTSIEKLHYEYFDNSPFTGINYYRLRQLDFDDHEKISQVRILSFGKGNINMTVFPNPVSDNIYINGIDPQAHLQLIDTKGSLVYRTPAKGSGVTIATNNLAPGVYFLQVTSNNTDSKAVKIIKR